MNRLQVFTQVRQWLLDNGAQHVKFGWIDPANEEALGGCEFPVVAMVPQASPLTALDTDSNVIEREEVLLVIWGTPGESPWGTDFGGFAALWEFRDKLLKGDGGFSALRQQVAGVPASPYLGSECDISPVRNEDYWYALQGNGFPAIELTIQISNHIGAAVLS